MQLAAWTICSSCCEAHLSKVACPRCTGAHPYRANKRIEIPAPQQAPRPRPEVQRVTPNRPAPAQKVPVATILSVLVFFTGLMLVGLGMMPAVGIILCAVPVIVRAILHTRERKAERATLANLGLRLE